MHTYQRGFTLIELSIVIIIIGLLVGSVLIGRDLIAASAANATVAQIEKYQSATNSFLEQYRALPGDIPQNLVTNFSFTTIPTRTGTGGRGDGNGLIEGYSYTGNGVSGVWQSGETIWFWEDLATNAGLIEGGFADESDTTPVFYTAQGYGGTTKFLGAVFPISKLNGSTFIYVYSYNGTNYYGLSGAGYITNDGVMRSAAGISVSQAYNMDKKIDDGLPQSGKVTAQYVNWDAGNVRGPVWAYNVSCINGSGCWTFTAGASGTAATPGSSSTCYDNNNVSGAVQQYSMAQKGGKNLSCALSFQFQ